MPEPKTLEELREELASLTSRRAEIIADANRAIVLANREFDRAALALNREIEKLSPTLVCSACGYKYGHRYGCKLDGRPPDAPASPRRRQSRRVSTAGTEGWSEDDLAHYKALQMQRV